MKLRINTTCENSDTNVPVAPNIHNREEGGGERGRKEKDDIVPSLSTPGATSIPPCDRTGSSEGGGTSNGAASSEGDPLG